MPSRKIYISDLDGTLLNSKGELSHDSRLGLVKLLEQRVPITVASARSYFSIRSILGDIPLALPVIEFNGAFITDYHSGEHLRINALSADISQRVLTDILKAGFRPFISTYNGSKDRLYYDKLINKGMRWYETRRRTARDPRLRQVADLYACLGEAVVSFTVMGGDQREIARLYAQLASEYGGLLRSYCYENEYGKGTFWLTIHDPRASKHLAMQELRDQYATGASIWAFGDNINDVEMLRHADHGIAVENAKPELKVIANEIIGANTVDSVIKYLTRCASEPLRTGPADSIGVNA